MLILPSITRYPFGVNNVALGKIFNNLPFNDRSIFHIYDQDFDQFVAADWTVTETQAGATQALVAGDGGLLALVNTAANNDVNQVQKTPAAFLLAAGKSAFMKFRAKVDDATLAAFAIGLQVVNADGTVLANATDGMFFLKPAAATSLNVYCRKDNAAGSTSAAAIAAMANDTFMDMALYYDAGTGNPTAGARLYYAINGNVLGYLDASATYFPDAILSPIAVVKNGSGVARTATIDQMFIAVER